MKPENRIVRHSLHQSLVAPLREMIMQGELRPGEKVPEEQLCERFGVSRTPIREALKVLAAEGALEILPHRGAIVARITEEQIAELFPIMASLERLAGALACRRADEADVARIKGLHEQMMACYRAEDERGYLRFNRLIHETFFDIAGNATLATLYQQILTRINACRFVVRKKPEHWRTAVAEHEEMVRLLEARDADALAALLERHVTGTTVGIARDFVAGTTIGSDAPTEPRAAAVA
ncbi:GntR family transcriptional regulator [Chenggangzhangella methanolivorans]|uniref:GntR family transcriptional regulator n=1 Tax=Chenggangzhangella methanolivorans TaxID=1437009 RepID=A0A9E6UJ21_9HYPH|nr:GntR family transcriptional regulator [Chenggangzhangella methanolivorans]QZO01488.1 GntR family transcriptional regulator [Chenggangzhangella methanolivorans]